MASLPDLDPVRASASTRTAERRRAQRLAVLLPGQLTLFDGVFACAIEDVSQTGARIVTNAPLRVGREAMLSCYPLTETCSIVWTNGQSAGVEFHERVSLGTVRLLRWNNDRYRSQHHEQVRRMLHHWVEQPELPQRRI